MNDGAAMLFLASEAAVRCLGLRPRARVVAAAEVGVDPRYMGMGPVPALRKALRRAGLNLGDFGLVELNEAFAAQNLACIDEVGSTRRLPTRTAAPSRSDTPLACPVPGS